MRVAGERGEGALEREEEIAALKEVLADTEGYAAPAPAPAPAAQEVSDDSERARLQSRLEKLRQDLEQAAAEQEAVARRKPDATQDIHSLRSQTGVAREAARALERRQAELEPQLRAAARACQRIAADITTIEQRIEQLRKLRQQSGEALEGARRNLRTSLKRKPEVDQALNEARRSREEADSTLASEESGRAGIQLRLAERREQLSEARVEAEGTGSAPRRTF